MLLFMAPAVAQCQTPNFAGTWRLDEGRSNVSLEATLVGLIGAGAPATLHITQPANGTLVIESQINESHSRHYVPGERTSTPVFLGEAGSITMMTTWDNRKLVSEGTRESPSGSATKVKETFALSDDGPTLEVEIVATSAEGTNTSTLRYTRIHNVGECASWPSPCKDFTRPNP